MKIKRYILFDLDGTLLPLSRQVFEPALFASFDALFRKAFPLQPELGKAFWEAMFSCESESGSPETNEERFSRLLRLRAGQKADDILNALEAHYKGEYNEIRHLITAPSIAEQALRLVEDAGAHAVLATNPVSSAGCIRARLGWIHLAPERFALVTTWDLCRYTKPDPRYYREILERLGAAPEDCLMVGNDTSDDMAGAAGAGIEVFLMTDHLMDKNNTASQYRSGSGADMLAFVKQYLEKGRS